MFEQVKTILVEEHDVKESIITLDANLVEDLGINSLDLADLVLACEENFGVTIDDEDIHKFVTVGDIVTFLEENK